MLGCARAEGALARGKVPIKQTGPETCPGPDATVEPAAYFFVVSRAIVESDDIGMLSCDMLLMPVSALQSPGAARADWGA